MENTNKIQFNATAYFNNPDGYTLETRGGVNDLTLSKNSYLPTNYPIRVKTSDGRSWTVTEKGFHGINAANELDLQMIPVTQKIPFTLELFKSGKYDVVSGFDGEIALTVKEFSDGEILCIYTDTFNTYGVKEYDDLRLRQKPITPYTHPEMYEVSDDEKNWYEVEKYFEYSEHESDFEYPHIAKTKQDGTVSCKHLRLKEPVTIITQQQADEVLTKQFGKFKIQG